MSNGVKLINYLQPKGDFLTFFSELDSSLIVGDKVFIVGGNYDNTVYTDKNNTLFDPFNQYANGYTVISIDNTDNSNGITLNIPFNLAKFNLSGLNTNIFNPLPVYLTEEELLLEPNQTREAYLSKSYFKRGEFNGGSFTDGIIGEYNIKGVSNPNNVYERQDSLTASTSGISDYTVYTTPSINNHLKFNNKFTSDSPATFTNGIFLGGEYQWGAWDNKFKNGKNGKYQTLNEFGTPFNISDESKFNIQTINDNNNKFGYGYIISGNIGKIYENNHSMTFTNGTNGYAYLTINDYLPYQLKKSKESLFKFKFSVKVSSNINSRIFEISDIDITNKKLSIPNNIKISTLGTTIQDVTNNQYNIEQLVFDEIGTFKLEIYVKDNTDSNGIKNHINYSTILHPDIFSGVFNNIDMLGGDIWGGEFNIGKLESKYSRLNFNDGIINGSKNNTVLNNVRWNNGTFIDGNWRGDAIVPIKNYVINDINNTSSENLFYIDIPSKYKHLFISGNKVFISYIKQSFGSNYLPNFTDKANVNPINFQEFDLVSIIKNDELDNLLLTRLQLKGAVDLFNQEVSLQYAKVSQSYFKKGVWNDGIWESGQRKVEKINIDKITYLGNNSQEIIFDVENTDNILLGDRVEASNIEMVRQIEVGIIDGVSNTSGFGFDNRGTNGSTILTFLEPLAQTLTVINIDINSTSGINKITVKFPILEDIKLDSSLVVDKHTILDIRKKELDNSKTELVYSVWVNGTFNSGIFDNGIFRSGTISSKLYFELTNNQQQAVFTNGYFKNGTITNSIFLSGVFENGTITSGIVSNSHENVDANSSTYWNNGDTVFINGTINNVEWRRGLILKAQINGGNFINGGFNNLDFKGGKFTNGLGIFDNNITANRSGKLLIDNTYSKLSAPSIIYIDRSGWVQLDQPSYYQNDYNIIFKDLDTFPNPFDGQMFNVINKDKFGTRLQVDYSTSGDNPLYLLDSFKYLNPILAIDNIADFTQIDEFNYWVADNGNNRILTINTTSGLVDVLGKIALKIDYWNFTGIKQISSNIDTNVYVVDTNNNVDYVRYINKLDKTSIFTYNNILDIDENIIDLNVIEKGIPYETVICLTSNNRLLYTTTKNNILKSIDLSLYVKNSVAITSIRKSSSTSIDVLILNNNTISHIVLDYNTGSDSYNIRNTSPIIINGLDFIVNPIKTFTAKYQGNNIEMYIVISDFEKNSNVFRFNYSDIFDSTTNIELLLNDDAIEYPINKIKMNYNNSLLNSTLSINNKSLILSNSNLFKTTTGFGVTQSLRLLDTTKLTSTNYWVYDNDTNRLIYVDEDNNNQYNADTDVDVLIDNGNTYKLNKITQGESGNIVYSIQTTNGGYSIRKSERGKIDSLNSTIINVVGHIIYDLVYVDKLYILVGDGTNVKIAYIDPSTNIITYLNSTVELNNNMCFDITKNGTDYIGVICSANTTTNVYELRINGTVLTTTLIKNYNNIINDVCIKYDETVLNYNRFSIFYANNDGVYRIISDKYLTPTSYRWSNFDYNLYFEAQNISEIYFNFDKSTIVASFGTYFKTFDSTYVTYDNKYESVAVNDGNIYAISNNRILKYASFNQEFQLEASISVNNSFNIGRYKQNSIKNTTATTDYVLFNPKSIVSSDNRLFFIDSDTSDISNVIRYYDYSSNINYDIVPSISGNIVDICHHGGNIYYLIKGIGVSTIGVFNATTLDIGTPISTTFEATKLSVNLIGGELTFVLYSDGVVYGKIGSGLWTGIFEVNQTTTDIVLLSGATLNDNVIYTLDNVDNKVYYYNGTNTLVLYESNCYGISENISNDKILLYKIGVMGGSSQVVECLGLTKTIINNIPLIKENINNNIKSPKTLNKLNNSYLFNEITKGYNVNKIDVQTLSPYITARILYKTVIGNNGRSNFASFNSLGTPQTAHIVGSKWNSGSFVGTWNQPNYLNNKILTDFSVFVDGTFNGDFYNGFFLGGNMNSDLFPTNLVKGHFSSNNDTVNINNVAIQSQYRYDIISMKIEKNLLNLKLEGLYLQSDNYINYPISLIGKDSWIKIPNLFNKFEFTIKEIWNSPIIVDGLNEITLVVENTPNVDLDDVSKLFINKEIFIESFEYSEYLFGTSTPRNVFMKDGLIYITIVSTFNKFTNTNKYIPTNKPKIVFNKYIKVLSSNSYIENDKSYSNIKIDLFTPYTSEKDINEFISTYYFNKSIQIIKDGVYENSVVAPNYLQVFNTSLSKTLHSFNATFNSALQNLLITDVIPTSNTDFSQIKVLVDFKTTVIAHDIIVDNSQISTPDLRKDVYVENSIFLSGKLYSNLRMSAWLNLDDKGFSNGKSQIGDSSNLYTFDGNNTKILNIFFEGNDYAWIELEKVMFNISKYRWITLRGFNGDKSQIIGNTRSRAFRVEEVKDNLVKIRNPFLYFTDFSSGFNMDKLSVNTQQMKVKGLEGSNVKVSNSDHLQLNNYDFSKAISNTVIDNNWYYLNNDMGNNYLVEDNKIKASFTTTSEYKKLYQNYSFIANEEYDFSFDYTATISGVNINVQILFDDVVMINNNITTTTTNGSIPFIYKIFETKDVLVSIVISGSGSGVSNIILNQLIITNNPIDENLTFNYGWASPSAFNGGDFYGDFNSIWNSGNFRNGNFNGEWFGSEENIAWNGIIHLSNNKLISNYDIILDLTGTNVNVKDYIYVKFNSIFVDGKMLETFGAYYGYVEYVDSKKVMIINTIDNIPTGDYSVNITKYIETRYTANYSTHINDFNFNVKINDEYSKYATDWNLDDTLVNGTNGVLVFNGINHIETIDYLNIANNDGDNNVFSIDLIFRYNDLTNNPLLSFQDSTNNMNGVKLYVLNNVLYLKYLVKDGSIISENVIFITDLSIDVWYHTTIIFKNGGVYMTLDTLDNSNKWTISRSTSSYEPLYLTKYDKCFIAKSINLINSTSETLTGYLDEIRFWNIDVSSVQNLIIDSDKKLRKYINKYTPSLTACYNVDSIKTLDNGNYFPEEETYYVLSGDNTIFVKDELSGTNFIYENDNLFIELDIFPENYTDITNTRAEYKLLTIQETRTLPRNVTNDYFLELIIKQNADNTFKFIIREKVCKSTSLIQSLLIYPITGIGADVDYSKDMIIDTNIDFYKNYNIILTDSELFLNGVKIGDYLLNNRNVFKYTVNTQIILGKYEFAYESVGVPIPSTNGLRGFVKNINLWQDNKFKDEYVVYRILSGENTDVYNDTTNISASNNALIDFSSNSLKIPYFNSDGSNKWESYIYSGENGYTSPITTVPTDMDINYLSTALPQPSWLEGDDFVVLNTSSGVITGVDNSNYLLTKDSEGTNSTIILSNMENFKFFGKKLCGSNGELSLNVADNGYLFFENLFVSVDNDTNLNYPLFDYTDNQTSAEYNQVKTTDAIMFSNILDIRETKGGFVKYADREDEFVIEFYGISTNFDNTNPLSKVYENTNNLTQEIASFYAIRIDKINSNILTYIRRVGQSDDQKILGLRRSDGYWSYINDTSGENINYYKQPNGKDFVIGYNSTSGVGLENVKISNSTEYILFVPRFEIGEADTSFAPLLANKDYDYIDTNYKLNILKEFNAKSLYQYDINNSFTDLNDSIVKRRISFITNNVAFISNDFNNFTNTIYDTNEQYMIGSTSLIFDGSVSETEALVSRDSFFYDGNFNAKTWHNGIFVDGNINVNNFVWKYGIKHNGRLQGGEKLIDYAYWLGGYHLGDNDNSFVRNLVWTRGIFNGGQWEKGHWLSLDLDNGYETNNVMNNDWSIFKGGEWYSRVDRNISSSVQNLFVDGNNGTFGGVDTNWNLEITNVTIASDANRCRVNNTNSGIVKGKSPIVVKRNTEYTITVDVNIPFGNVGNVNVIADGNSDIINIKNVGYKRVSNSDCKYIIKDNITTPYELVAEATTGFIAKVTQTFNSGNNDSIYIKIYSDTTTPFLYYIDNIVIIGENITDNGFDPYVIQNHNSIWHGGTWISDVKQKQDSVEYFNYTYESSENKLYYVQNNQTITLPMVNSIWLGGMWLRGLFKGGIIANAFWHSVDSSSGLGVNTYEDRIDAMYNQNASIFSNGKMINSVWYGGTVNNLGNKFDVVFGDLINLKSLLPNGKDFTIKNTTSTTKKDFEFYRSDFIKGYNKEVLGKLLFTGFHYDPNNSGDTPNKLIQIEEGRVSNQYNNDGIMSVYWKRGSFNNGVFQFSHWDSLDLDNENQSKITSVEIDNYSIFRKGFIYSSEWVNGLYYANSSRETYPFETFGAPTDEPNSLFYYSHWNKGYWKAIGLKNSGSNGESTPFYSSLDTTDDIEITNALFSRSLWDSGVFEGGTMELSIWRSGVTEDTTLVYKNSSAGLTKTLDITNPVFFINSTTYKNADFDFSTSGVSGLDFITNDNTFIDTLKDSRYRFVGSVDNLASIFVNGHMKGCIWHGGIWQRGMFQHKSLIDVDFFERNININSSLDKFQLGIWNRGLWLSGYFSYYNDAIINRLDITEDDVINKHLYLYDNGVLNSPSKRCLFMSINAVNVDNNSNIIGINSGSFNTLVSNINNVVDNVNNYSSFFMRRLLKGRTNTLGTTLPDKKPYFSVMNGSVLNGILYNDISMIDDTHLDRYILSANATVSNKYIYTTTDSNYLVSVNNQKDSKAFLYDIYYSSSISDKFTIPYNLTPFTNSASNWVSISDNPGYLINYNNGTTTITKDSPCKWRHNIDDTITSGVVKFGDGTTIINLGVRPMAMGSVYVSIAQGDGQLWINSEDCGEPRYKSGDIELKYLLYSFETNVGTSPYDGFDDEEFDTNLLP